MDSRRCVSSRLRVVARPRGTPPQHLVQYQRAQLGAAEQRVSSQLSARYVTDVRVPLAPHIRAFSDAYAQKLRELRAATGDPHARMPVSWLLSSSSGPGRRGIAGGSGVAGGGDLRGLQRTVGVHVLGFARDAQHEVAGGMRDASQLGDAHARQQLTAAMQPAASVLTPEQYQQLISQWEQAAQPVRSDAQFALTSRLAGSGTSLGDLFDSLDQDTADRLYRVLLAGLADGDNPASVASLISGVLDSSLSRALTIARTEMLGAYRSAQLDNYRANSDVVGQWQWCCDQGPRTCELCLGMDGSIHDLDEDMDSHVNCRCSANPVTLSWSDILAPFGVDGSDLDAEDALDNTRLTGQEWFDQQDAATQRSILGPAAYNAYSAGAISSLSDFIGQRDAETGGTGGGYYRKSLKDLGLDAQAWLGRGPNAGVPVRITLPGGGVTYVTPGPPSDEEPVFNMAGRSQGWGGIDDVMKGLR